MPRFSIIIAVYNDWAALESCLHFLAQQTDGPDFEVIVVDDGSDDPAPEKIRQWKQRLPLNIVGQPHAGISAARNHGIRISKASMLLFVDADSRLQAHCLKALESTVTASPQHNCFQLRMVGDCSSFVGRTEHLRLAALQDHLLQPNGCMRYLNTAGFAIRRSIVPIEKGLFETAVLRAEDTVLLADLMQRGELPFFVSDAIVQHEMPRSLRGCLRKDVRSAFLEGKTYALIASRGIRIRVSHRERWTMVRSMWRASKLPSIGRPACLVLILRQALSRATSFTYRLLHHRSGSQEANFGSLKENR
jgi:glycosyltransferase involved in cell wall biosynthesis